MSSTASTRLATLALVPPLLTLTLTPAAGVEGGVRATPSGQEASIPPAPNPTPASERASAWRRHEQMRLSSPYRGLHWRAVGPRMQGGRVEAVAVDPRDPATRFVGVGAGNLWKTVNAGVTWRPVLDRASTFTIGDVTLAPSDPDVVWVGTGEVLMARSSYAGSGVFRSTDGGETWDHVGLADTHHIARVLVHPDDPETAWVAAVGHLYSFNEERGVFKTDDGGASWDKVLYVDDRTGAIELAMEPGDPNTLYAATWQRSRRAWGHTSSGQGSGIHRSTDGGRTWTRLGGGFPSGEHVGRIALAVAASRPNVVYALMDDRTPQPPGEGGRRKPSGVVYRSDDRGETWRRVDAAGVAAGYDFCQIRVSPDDPDTVYVPGQLLWASEDGGRNFRELGGTIVHLLHHDATVLHLDQHEMWIDPGDPDHWIVGNDGGVYETWDRAASWLHWNNLPIAEFYAINLDMEEPYNIYGGTQDDAALYGPSDREYVDGREDPWRHVYLDPWGGGDSYFTPPHPIDTWVVFYEHQFGELRRKDMRDGTTVSIRPRAAEGEPDLRNNWMTPFLISRYDPDALYYATQFVHKSTDRGDSWKVISPDLTTDPGAERQGNVPFGTITTVSESSLRSGMLWVGSDDGRVHVTRDDGATWVDVTGNLPDRWVSGVAASPHDPERAFVAMTGYREDDFAAYLWVTDDGGATWRSIAPGLPGEPVNVIVEDPEVDGILYVGTDLGAYVSADGGRTWDSLVADLPTTPVVDLALHPRDGELVAGTHGRSAFVLDVKPIRAHGSGDGGPVRVFEIAPAVRGSGRDTGPGTAPYRPGTTSGEAVIVFALAAPGGATLEIVDTAGDTVHRANVDGIAGLNVVRWDLIPDDAERTHGAFARPTRRVAPGTYRVVVEAGAARDEAILTVIDP